MIDESRIIAYLTPHPLDEENSYEDDQISWLPGFLNEPDEEQGLPAYLREENIRFYENLEADAKKRLMKAMVTLWPLLKDHHFKYVQIAIDVFGIMLSKNSIAGYNHEDSDPEKGRYIFILSRSLLWKYLAYKSDGKPLDFHDDHTWEHELIHLLDHKESLKGSLFQSSFEPRDILRSSILKFRSEGIADLFYLLHGHHKSVGSIEEARKTFKNLLSGWMERHMSKVKVSEEIKVGIELTQLHYTAGPWLILDMLRTFEGHSHREIIEVCLKTISRREAVDQDTILKVIETALRINSQSFLDFAETEWLSDAV
jgi:hypothetical protein